MGVLSIILVIIYTISTMPLEFEVTYKDYNSNNEILFLDKCLDYVMEMTPEDLCFYFGEYDSWDKNEYFFDSINYGIDSDGEKEDGWIIFQMGNENGKYQVIGIITDPNNITLNGQRMLQDFDTLVSIFGEDYVDVERTRYSWTIMWKWNNSKNELYFTFSDKPGEDKPYLICIH